MFIRGIQFSWFEKKNHIFVNTLIRGPPAKVSIHESGEIFNEFVISWFHIIHEFHENWYTNNNELAVTVLIYNVRQVGGFRHQ